MLTFQNITKKFGRKKVLSDATLTIKKGEITCLVGINGIGKTTLLNAVMRVIPMTKGDVLIDGKRVTTREYKRIAYVTDDLPTYAGATVSDLIDLMKGFYDWNLETERLLLKKFKLSKSDKAAALSKGNRAKLNILLGLCTNAEYLLLDEPFAGIDVFTKQLLLDIFTSELVESRGVLIVTHEIDTWEYLIDKVACLNEGRIVKEFYAEEERATTGRSVIDVLREVYEQ